MAVRRLSINQEIYGRSLKDGWYDVRDVVVHGRKSNALSVEDEESGLLPFMMVGEACDCREYLRGLSMAYELLCINPGVLKEYS